MKFIYAYVLNGKVWYEVTDTAGTLLLKTTDMQKAYKMMEVVL